MGCGCSRHIARVPANPQQFLQEGFSDKYDLDALVGSGSFARVFKVKTHRKPVRIRVTKIMEDSGWGSEEWSTRSVYIREASILKSLRHAHIVRCFDFYAENDLLYMVLEYLPGGELFQHLVKHGRLDEEETRHLTHQMLSAIAYLHGNNIIYRDVKADNFVFTDARCCSIKMIDFGLAMIVDKSALPLEEVCGSPHYLAPELIGQKYGFPVDLWALGILVFLLLHGHYPFDAPNTQELVVFVLTVKISDQISDSISEQGRKFLMELCEQEETKRLSAKKAQEHKWLTGNDRKFLRKTVTDPALEFSKENEILKISDVSPKTLKSIHRQFSLPLN
jgi:serine/threonine-protein kinase SIK3